MKLRPTPQQYQNKSSPEELVYALMEAELLRYQQDNYKSELKDYKEKLDKALAEIEKLRAIIAEHNRHRFGRRSEKLDPDQQQLAWEDLDQELAAADAAAEAAAAAAAAAAQPPQPEEPPKPKTPRTPRNANRGNLPKHLPRIEVVIAPDSTACPCCNAAMHVIGEERSEQLDRIPATLQVKVTVRPVYGCRDCQEAVVQAPAPERPIGGGLPTETLLASVLIDKYCDSIPLYRQAMRFAREGITLDRQTLCRWVGHTSYLITPVYDYILADLFASPVLFGDDTTIPVLDPGKGKVKTGRFWGYGRDERPWQGSRPPAVAYFYEEDRRHEHARRHLADFKGILHCDAYGAYDSWAKERKLAGDSGLVLAHCNVHARRKLYEVFQKTGSPIAAEGLRRYAELYAIEAEIRHCPPERRQQVRQERSRPLMESLFVWQKAQLQQISGKTKLAEALRYSIGREKSLSLFLTDGRLEMDTNTIERPHRTQKLTAKNALFAGSDGGARNWAKMATIFETCKLNGVDPFAYLRDTLIRIVNRHPMKRIDELMPWNYPAAPKPQSPAPNPSG